MHYASENMHNLGEQAEDRSGAQPKLLPPYGATQNKFHLVEADGGQGDRVPLKQIASTWVNVVMETWAKGHFRISLELGPGKKAKGELVVRLWRCADVDKRKILYHYRTDFYLIGWADNDECVTNNQSWKQKWLTFSISSD